MKRWILFSALAVCSLFAQEPSDDSKNLSPIDSTALAVGQLVDSFLPGYYASAIVAGADDQSLFLITNDHAIPREPETLGQLRFKSSITGYHLEKAELLGRAPGYDVAVLRIPRQDPAPKGPAGEKLHAAIRGRFLNDVVHLPKELSVRAALIGVPRYWEGMDSLLVQTYSWADALEHISRNPALPTELPTAALHSRVAVETVTDCPPPFLEACYRLPLPSWGYSGGALAVESPQHPEWPILPILGMISHFTPFSGTTYVIPLPIALRVADRLRARFALTGKPVVETRDESGTFELTDDEQIRILTGPLAGNRVSRPDGKYKAGGFGESRGGSGITQPGGESRGGSGITQPGGESRGGSGATSSTLCPTCFVVVPDEAGNTFLYGRWAQLKESAAHPENWGQPADVFTAFVTPLLSFKGIDALFSYHPGIQVEGAPLSLPYLELDGQPLVTVRTFLDLYRKKPSRELSSFAFSSSKRFPYRLRMEKGWENAGLHSQGSLRRWKKLPEVEAAFRAKKVSTLGYAEDELDAVIKNNQPDNLYIDPKGLDLISSRERSTGQGALQSADALFFTEKMSALEFVDSRVGKMRLQFFGEWKSYGSYFYEVRGGILVERGGKSDYSGQGVALLEWDPEAKHWELRVLVANRGTGSSDPYFEDEEIRLDAFYLPLVEARL